MTGPQFCGYAVPGDRGGPAETCGKALPCESHRDARSERIAAFEIESTTAIEYLLRATAMTTPPSKAPSKLIAMAAIAAHQAKTMHDGMHEAMAKLATAITRAVNAEAAITNALEWLRLSDEEMGSYRQISQVDRAMLTLGEYLEQKKLREGGKP